MRQAANTDATHDEGLTSALSLTEKCESILRQLLSSIQEGDRVALTMDQGPYSITLIVNNGHAHIGLPGAEGSWEQFIDSLHEALSTGQRAPIWHLGAH